ncbi:acetate/propionate family kinase, partial [Schaalia hyovaginalis]
DLIEQLCPMAPLHNPAHLKGIDVARELMPDIPHVAVFDTAFFQQLPEKASTYALNAEVAEKYAVRRYGAHGTSHQFVSREVAKLLGRDDLKQIVMHLGNGASVSAVKDGKPIDTSMGLTPLEGLMMGSRTGDIDPAVVFHLARQAGMSIDEIDHLFNKESGMKGLTGETDMRSVWGLIGNDEDPETQTKARVAMDIYINRLLKYVGSYTAELGGLDVITFTAGIGENDWRVRRELAEALEPFGVKIDVEKNEGRIGEPRVVSTPDSKVLLLVYPTNEELAIARQALTLL